MSCTVSSLGTGLCRCVMTHPNTFLYIDLCVFSGHPEYCFYNILSFCHKMLKINIHIQIQRNVRKMSEKIVKRMPISQSKICLTFFNSVCHLKPSSVCVEAAYRILPSSCPLLTHVSKNFCSYLSCVSLVHRSIVLFLNVICLK